MITNTTVITSCTSEKPRDSREQTTQQGQQPAKAHLLWGKLTTKDGANQCNEQGLGVLDEEGPHRPANLEEVQEREQAGCHHGAIGGQRRCQPPLEHEWF